MTNEYFKSSVLPILWILINPTLYLLKIKDRPFSHNPQYTLNYNLFWKN